MGRHKALESAELYTVGWIAALFKEMTAALAMLDERHDKPKDFVKPSSDTNAYRWGRIGDHNVVIASLAAGVYGTTSAATTAIHMLSSFPSIKVGLMVGIGAAIPGPKHDIRLGDVVVSQPQGKTGGVVQYDLGKSRVSTVHGNTIHAFEQVGSLRPPPEALLKALSLLKAEVKLEGSSISQFLEEMIERYPQMAESEPDEPGYVYQGQGNDRLFEASYLHTSAMGCDDCNPARMISRAARRNPHVPRVHYGVIASGNRLVKDAVERERILEMVGGDCICLEMEAAGLMNSFPCLVIRGICDYADSHKNDDWQEYAAATAAAYAKEFLAFVDNGDLVRTSKASEILEQISEDLKEIQINVNITGEAVQALQLNHHQREIRKWLQAPDPSMNYSNALEKRHKDTGLWFVRSEAFQKWKGQPNSFLWLHGIAGCGKTVLSSTIIKHLGSDIEPDRPLLYFYFDFNESNKQDLENMLRSLTSQLYQAQPEARSLLDELWRSHGNGSSQLSKHSLSSTLLEMLRKVTNTSILLDALDESTTRGDVITWIKSVLRLGSGCRVLVTARREEDIETGFQHSTQQEDWIDIRKGDIDGDLREYVSYTVRNSSELERWQKRPDVQDEIESELLEKADGMFRWVACQIDALKNCYDYPRLQRTLRDLPRTLNDTYTRILESIPREHIQQTMTILNLLVWSDWTFSTDELVDAIAVNMDEDPRFNPKNRMPVPRELLKLCSSLVVVSQVAQTTWHNIKGDFVDVVRLAHFSVKEYLISDHVSRVCGSLLSEPVARAYLATLCLTYLLDVSKLQLPCMDEHVDRWELIKQIRLRFPFAAYCGGRWMDYGRGIEPQHESLWQLITSLFERSEAFLLATVFFPGGSVTTKKPVAPIVYASYHGLTQAVAYLIDKGAESAEADATAAQSCLDQGLGQAASRGHVSTVQLLLDRGAYVNAQDDIALCSAPMKGIQSVMHLLPDRGADVNARDGEALTEASAAGHRQIVQLLLDRGADVNARDGSALINASAASHRQIVQLLLDRGADVNARDGEALIEASAAGHRQIVQLLLDRGADVNARDGSALINASEGGYHKTVQLLLDKGADVNARDGSALINASADSHRQIVRLLLKRGADVNARDNNALKQALAHGRHKIVQLLLDRGADVNARDGKALIEASAAGHRQIVQLLLDRGADVNAQNGAALHHASKRGRPAIIRLLLDNGADFNARDEDGAHALMAVLKTHHDMTVKMLHVRDADQDLIDWIEEQTRRAKGAILVLLEHLSSELAAQVDRNKMNTLQYAALYGSEATVQRCLGLGVDVRVRDHRGMTALHWAAWQGHLAIFNMLVRAGSDLEELSGYGWTILHLLADLAPWERRARSWERGRKRDRKSSSEYDSVRERSPEGSEERGRERSLEYNRGIDWEAQYQEYRKSRGRPSRRRSR